MTEDKSFLGIEPIGKLLFQMALPTVIAQVVNMLYNIVDRIYIGHIPNVGKDALAGVGVCMPIIMVVSAFAALVSTGGAPRASIFMGENNYDKAEKTMGGCFTLQIFISVLLTAVLLIFNRDILPKLGASANTIDYAVGYMNIYAVGTLFVQLTLGMNAFITAQGFAKTGMVTVIIGAVTNIILDPIFIFTFNMGVQGAALATIISQCASCVFSVAFLFSKKSTLKLKKKNFFVDPMLILPCVALGLATFIMQASEGAIAVCFNVSLQKYGGDMAVCAMAILTSVMQFAMLPLMGIGQGAQPITSYNYGAKNADRVKETFLLLLKVCTVYSVCLWAIIMVAPGLFARIFSSDATIIAFTAKALRIYCGALLVFGVQIACQMTFVSIGNAVCSIIVALMRKFVLLIPMIFIVPVLVVDKTTGVYMAEPIADFIAVIFTGVLFYKIFNQSLGKLNE